MNVNLNLPVIITSSFLIILYILVPFTMEYCQTGLSYSILRVFSHQNLQHLMFNLFAFINISNNLVNLIGIQRFSYLLIGASVLDILTDWIIHGRFVSSCSVGFSGVVYALLAYLTLSIGQLSGDGYGPVITNLGILLLGDMTRPGISVMGHSLGALIGGLLFFLSV